MLKQDEINRLRAANLPPRAMIIDGEICQALSGRTREVISPIDGTVLTTIPDGAAEDAERAIAAARVAFEDGRWSRMAPQERKKIMHRWADLIEAEALSLTVMGVRENGTEIATAIDAEAGSAVTTIRYYAEAIDKIYGEIAPTPDGILGLIHHEPVGVVGAIVPWNFPLMIGAWKLGPALATGNTVILKPAETASLTLLRIGELALEAGIPAGVLNVVTGAGSVVGEAMARSMEIDVITFTGSGGVGRRLLENAAKSNLKRVYLELGGKSANIVFADTPDLDTAARAAAAAIFKNAGQVCVAGSRLLLERCIYDEFLDRLAQVTQGLIVGDPLDLNSNIGAINSARQLTQNLSFVDTAQAEGGTLLLGGKRILADTGGFYMEPTIVAQVAPHHRLVQEEVFGPVLAVMVFDDEAEAVKLANCTSYGLAGAVWTADLARTLRMIRAVKTGMVQVNRYAQVDITSPLGGVKQSGNGHDRSLHALDKFTNLKTAWIQF